MDTWLTIFIYIVVAVMTGVFYFLGYYHGKSNGHREKHQDLALSVDEALFLLRGEYSELVKVAHNTSMLKHHMRERIREYGAQLANRLKDGSANKAYKLYALRDEIESDISHYGDEQSTSYIITK